MDTTPTPTGPNLALVLTAAAVFVTGVTVAGTSWGIGAAFWTGATVLLVSVLLMVAEYRADQREVRRLVETAAKAERDAFARGLAVGLTSAKGARFYTEVVTERIMADVRTSGVDL